MRVGVGVGVTVGGKVSAKVRARVGGSTCGEVEVIDPPSILIVQVELDRGHGHRHLQRLSDLAEGISREISQSIFG